MLLSQGDKPQAAQVNQAKGRPRLFLPKGGTKMVTYETLFMLIGLIIDVATFVVLVVKTTRR